VAEHIDHITLCVVEVARIKTESRRRVMTLFTQNEVNWGPCIYRHVDFHSEWKMNMKNHFHFKIQTGVL